VLFGGTTIASPKWTVQDLPSSRFVTPHIYLASDLRMFLSSVGGLTGRLIFLCCVNEWEKMHSQGTATFLSRTQKRVVEHVFQRPFFDQVFEEFDESDTCRKRGDCNKYVAHHPLLALIYKSHAVYRAYILKPRFTCAVLFRPKADS
jgi:hypothetical protein